MKKTQRKEIQEKTLEELVADGRNLRQEIFNLRLQQASAQLEKLKASKDADQTATANKLVVHAENAPSDFLSRADPLARERGLPDASLAPLPSLEPGRRGSCARWCTRARTTPTRSSVSSSGSPGSTARSISRSGTASPR